MTDKLDEAALEKSAEKVKHCDSFRVAMEFDSRSEEKMFYARRSASEAIKTYLTETKLLEKLKAAEDVIGWTAEELMHGDLGAAYIVNSLGQTLKTIRGNDG